MEVGAQLLLFPFLLAALLYPGLVKKYREDAEDLARRLPLALRPGPHAPRHLPCARTTHEQISTGARPRGAP